MSVRQSFVWIFRIYPFATIPEIIRCSEYICWTKCRCHMVTIGSIGIDVISWSFTFHHFAEKRFQKTFDATLIIAELLFGFGHTLFNGTQVSIDSIYHQLQFVNVSKIFLKVVTTFGDIWYWRCRRDIFYLKRICELI